MNKATFMVAAVFFVVVGFCSSAMTVYLIESKSNASVASFEVATTNEDLAGIDEKDRSTELDFLKQKLSRLMDQNAELQDIVASMAEQSYFEYQGEYAVAPQNTGNVSELDLSNVDRDEALHDQDEDAQAVTKVERMEAGLQDIGRNPDWASDSRQLLEQTYSSFDYEGVNLANAECGSELCKIDFVVDEAISPNEISYELISAIPWRGEVLTRIGGEEQNEITMFIASEGSLLP